MEGECGSEMENGGVLSQQSTVINLRPSDGGADSELVDLSGKVHQLPCAIKYDGPCSVSHYFKPKSTGKKKKTEKHPKSLPLLLSVAIQSL